MPLTEIQAQQLTRIGDNVRRERHRVALTQEQLAEKADLNWRTVQKIESGSLNILVSTLIRLKRALRCPWDRLLP